MSSPSRPSRALIVSFLLAAFAFRLFYGLSMPFWLEDERQVYLIGLRSFARGLWPYFGADVVWTGGQLLLRVSVRSRNPMRLRVIRSAGRE